MERKERLGKEGRERARSTRKISKERIIAESKSL